ncbi:MAG: glycosyltransferase [Lachnospiraceae bacterium]|nr:glycosyltransferase [Lachnospiraceae bacterium]
MEKKFVSVVVYLNNCGAEIEKFLSAVIPTVQNYFENYELVCVDDACTDNTIELVREYTKKNTTTGMVSVVHMGKYQGLEPSMNAGRDVAIGDFVYEFDTTVCDYEPGVITDVYEALVEGYDIVSAYPSSGSKLFSKLFYGIYNRSNRGRAKIGTETFRLISRRAINRIKSMGDYIPYRKAVYANCGLESKRIPYAETDKSKNGRKTRQRVTLAMDSFIYFTNFLERISTVISVFFLLATVAFVSYAVYDYLVNKAAIEGWTSIICFMSFGFFGVFLMLTIVLKYMSAMLNMVFKRQKYLVSSIEKVGNDR